MAKYYFYSANPGPGLMFVAEYNTFTSAQNAAHELLRGYYFECIKVKSDHWEFHGHKGVVGRIIEKV